MIRIRTALARRLRLSQLTDDGFTLIELLVVILIIGVLTGIALPVFLGIQAQAHRTAVETDVHHLITTMEKDAIINGQYTVPADAEVYPTIQDGVTLDLFIESSTRYYIEGRSNNLDGGTILYIYYNAEGHLGWSDDGAFAMPTLPAVSGSWGFDESI